MTNPAPRFNRLLRSWDRCGSLLRWVECGGIGLVIGAAVAVLLSLLLYTERRSSVEITALLLTLGSACGVMWGVWRRPSIVGTALRADRQLGTDDLFSTAAAMSTSTAASDPWAATLLAVAEARSLELSPARVVFRRLSGRSWSGICLAVATALTLAVLTSTPAASDAATGTNPLASPTAPPPPRPLVVLAPDGGISPARDGGRQEEDGNPSSAQDPATAAAPPPATAPATGTPEAASPESTHATAGAQGTSPGSGETNTQPSTSPIARMTPGVGATTNALRPVGTQPAGGIGTVDTRPPIGDPASDPGGSGVGAAATGGGTTVAPWNAPSWQADVEAAKRQLQNGQIPAAYRDLVRQFFDVE